MVTGKVLGSMSQLADGLFSHWRHTKSDFRGATTGWTGWRVLRDALAASPVYVLSVRRGGGTGGLVITVRRVNNGT
jgi:hypothetical protein